MAYEIDIASDLFNGGYNEDGEIREELAYYVRATDADGQRFVHFKNYTTKDMSREQCEEKIARLAANISVAQDIGKWTGPVGSEHWTEVQPCYGSLAYSRNAGAYAAQNDLLDGNFDTKQREDDLLARASEIHSNGQTGVRLLDAGPWDNGEGDR